MIDRGVSFFVLDQKRRTNFDSNILDIVHSIEMDRTAARDILHMVLSNKTDIARVLCHLLLFAVSFVDDRNEMIEQWNSFLCFLSIEDVNLR